MPCILEACTESQGVVTIIFTWCHSRSSTLFYGTWYYVSQPHLHTLLSTEKKCTLDNTHNVRVVS